MLKLSNIVRSFGTTQVLKNIDLEIHEGEHFFLLGPSGCGKTTLLRIVAGLTSPDSGQIVLNGNDITSLKPELRPVHTVFQHYALFPHLDVKENIGFGLKIARVPVQEINSRVRDILALVKLSGYEDRSINQLSGGEQQRIAIARALVNQPKILLLDEPLSAIDEQLKRQLLLDLKEIKQKIRTIFIHVTHHQEEALALADRIAVMNAGEVLQVDTPEKIYHTPKNKQVASFIGRASFLPVQVNNGQAQFRDHTTMPLTEIAPPGAYHAFIGVRPENVQIAVPGETRKGFTPTLTGKVRSRLFSGNMIELQIKTGAGSISALCTFEQAASLQEDQDIAVMWQTKNTLLFKDTHQP